MDHEVQLDGTAVADHRAGQSGECLEVGCLSLVAAGQAIETGNPFGGAFDDVPRHLQPHRRGCGACSPPWPLRPESCSTDSATAIGGEFLGFLEQLRRRRCDMRYVAIVEGGDDVLRDVIFNRYVIPVSTRI